MSVWKKIVWFVLVSAVTIAIMVGNAFAATINMHQAIAGDSPAIRIFCVILSGTAFMCTTYASAYLLTNIICDGKLLR